LPWRHDECHDRTPAVQAGAGRGGARAGELCHAPSRYRHWSLDVEGDVARLKLDIDEDGGIKPGYKLKLNSYDLGVDIELHDALNRIRFEHPRRQGGGVRKRQGPHLVLRRQHLHAGPVHARMEGELLQVHQRDPQRPGRLFAPRGPEVGRRVTGACAGGGYELALACDRIVMVDDRSSTVSLPEVPLLGVLPGTGGLTRVTDKRKVRATWPTSSAPPAKACAPIAPGTGS
jgi:benzoyl-CoA-dihydrodiol lyase